jgi:hypothetical protein
VADADATFEHVDVGQVLEAMGRCAVEMIAAGS